MEVNETHVNVAIDLYTRRYPDVTVTSLLYLRGIERLREHPGYENARHWGHGPHHKALQRLGLVTIGSPDPVSLACPVDMTADGQIVAEILRALRCGKLQLRPEDLAWYAGEVAGRPGRNNGQTRKKSLIGQSG